MGKREWYYQLMGEVVGPLSSEELRQHAADGQLSRDTLVRKGEDGPWVLPDKLWNVMDGASTTFGGLAEKSRRPAETSVQTSSSQRRSIDDRGDENDPRYPMLEKYLALSVFALDVGILLGVIGLLLAVGWGLTEASHQKDNGAWWVATVSVLGVLGAVWLAVSYVAGRAGIEFIRVVMDVEANTRKRVR
jgi:hypothetical protein